MIKGQRPKVGVCIAVLHIYIYSWAKPFPAPQCCRVGLVNEHNAETSTMLSVDLFIPTLQLFQIGWCFLFLTFYRNTS